MRTKKKDLISDELKPIVSKIICENRKKYNMSLEDLSKAINHKKNRQTLHKYENGTLNISYDLFSEICNIFNYKFDDIDSFEINEKEKEIIENKIIKNYIKKIGNDNSLNYYEEKMINTYKNMYFEPVSHSNVFIKMLDDSMAPYYEKNDRIYFNKQEEYENGDDIVIAIKSNVLVVRRLYKYNKGIILQAINPKYNTININIISNNMILGKVSSIYRELKKMK